MLRPADFLPLFGDLPHTGHLGIVQPPRRGPHVEVDHRWLPAELGAAVDGLLASRAAAR